MPVLDGNTAEVVNRLFGAMLIVQGTQQFGQAPSQSRLWEALYTFRVVGEFQRQHHDETASSPTGHRQDYIAGAQGLLGDGESMASHTPTAASRRQLTFERNFEVAIGLQRHICLQIDAADLRVDMKR